MLSQSRFVQFTLMPVDFVNASSAALGGDWAPRVTLIVTPLVASDAPLSSLPHAVPNKARPDRMAMPAVSRTFLRGENMSDASRNWDWPGRRTPSISIRKCANICAFDDRSECWTGLWHAFIGWSTER